MSQKRSNIPLKAILKGHRSGIWTVSFHPTAPLLATAGSDNEIRIWETNTHQCIAILEGHTSYVTSVAFHPTEPILLVSGSDDNTIKVWDIISRECLSSTTRPHPHGVSCVAVHPSKSLIASSGFIDVPKLWQLSPDNRDVTLVNEVWSINHRHPSVNSVVFHTTEPLIATTGSDGKAMLWLQLSQNRIQWLGDMDTEGANRDVNCVAFHPTAPVLLTGGNGKKNNLKLWQINFDQRSTDQPAGNPPTAQALIDHYSVSSIDCIATLMGHTGDVTSVAFHPSAPVFVSGSTDKTIKLWRILPNEIFCMATFTEDTRVTSVAFHSNGRLLASGNSGNTAFLWDCSVLTSEGQRNIALLRGLQENLLPRLFSGRMRNMPFQADFLRNKFKQRSPNFLEEIEIPAKTATARARATATARARSMIQGPIPRQLTTSPKSSPKSRSKSRSRTPSPSSKGDKSRGGASITQRRRKHSSRKVKHHASKTRRYHKFIR
jgi:WD40 repeat protein